jgi:chromosome segregation ATPase
MISEHSRQQIAQLEQQLDDTNEELLKTQKAILKKESERDEVQVNFEGAKASLEQTKGTLAKTDAAYKQTQETLKVAEKDLRTVTKELEETKEKLKETEEELATTKRTLEETRTESAAMKVSFEKVISDLEEELYDETIQKERLLKVKAELEAEVASLRWYFQPLDEQADEPEKKANVDDFFVNWRNNLNEELRVLADRSKRDKQNRRTLGELEDSLKEALSSLSDEYREDAVPELEDLMKAMTMADFKTKTKLQIFCILIENRCQPGVIREFANVCLDLAEGKQVHLMETPEMIIKFAYRDMQNSDGALSLRDAILDRLAQIRSRKMKIELMAAKITILEGGEYEVPQ